jgi:hypothetical protein
MSNPPQTALGQKRKINRELDARFAVGLTLLLGDDTWPSADGLLNFTLFGGISTFEMFF